MILTNQQIYNYATQLVSLNLDMQLPVRINFFLNRNIQTIISLGEEIEKAKMQIAQNFGEPLKNGPSQYIIPEERFSEAQKELNDLFALTQEINLHIFKLDDFEGIELTYQQMSALMFMIEE